MTEQNPKKPDYEEKATWINHDKAVVQCVEMWPNRHDDGTYGPVTRKTNVYPEATLADLQKPLEDWKKELEKERSGLEDAEKSLKQLGKKPVRTPEMIRLSESLRKIGLIEQINKKEGKRDYHKSTIEYLEKQISEREKTLAAAPKKDESTE